MWQFFPLSLVVLPVFATWIGNLADFPLSLVVLPLCFVVFDAWFGNLAVFVWTGRRSTENQSRVLQ